MSKGADQSLYVAATQALHSLKLAAEKHSLQTEKIAEQDRELSAHRKVLDLLETGMIDVGQARTELTRILKFGVDLYMEVVKPSNRLEFGDMVEQDESTSRVENAKIAYTLDGEQITSLERHLREVRQKRFGIPTGLVEES